MVDAFCEGGNAVVSFVFSRGMAFNANRFLALGVRFWENGSCVGCASSGVL